MKTLPSKELLSEVFKREVSWSMLLDEDTDTHNSYKLHFQFKDVYYGGISGIEDEQINIYELSHKCKEWAKILGIEIDSHCGCARWGASAERHISSYSVFYEQVFIASTEPEAIFKACEWIMEHLSDNPVINQNQ